MHGTDLVVQLRGHHARAFIDKPLPQLALIARTDHRQIKRRPAIQDILEMFPPGEVRLQRDFDFTFYRHLSSFHPASNQANARGQLTSIVAMYPDAS
jgi:hypothetical protein